MTRPYVKGSRTQRRRDVPKPKVAPLTGPYSLTVLGAPVTKKNSPQIALHRATGRPFVVPSKAYKTWSKQAIPQVLPLAYERGAIEQPVCLTATIYRARRVGDLVNYIQATADLLQDAGLLVDDKWVMALDGSRLAHDRYNPRVEITLTPITV